MSCIANADYVISDDNLDNLVSHVYMLICVVVNMNMLY